MKEVGYEQAFMFAYSERAGTAGARHRVDDVSAADKQRRLQEIIDAFRGRAGGKQQGEVGRTHLCLVEGPSKKDPRELSGRTDTSKMAIFGDAPVGIYGGGGVAVSAGGVELEVAERGLAPPKAGEYVAVRITGCSTGTLFGECLGRTTLAAFQGMHGGAWAAAGAAAAAAVAVGDKAAAAR